MNTCTASTCNTDNTATNASSTQNRRTFRPHVDVVESASEFVITADVPGATPPGVDVHAERGVLTVRAAIAPSGARTRPGVRQIISEYPVGDYERSFRIGDGIDMDRISAELKQGVLTVRLPKADVKTTRKIAVNG